jgi:hypothetical protein
MSTAAPTASSAPSASYARAASATGSPTFAQNANERRGPFTTPAARDIEEGTGSLRAHQA